MVRQVQQQSWSQVGSTIRQFRHHAGYSQKRLADAAGVSVGLVRDLEQGRTHSPRWGSVEALALALDLTAQERGVIAAAWHRGTADQGQRRALPAAGLMGRAGAVTIGLLGPLRVEGSGSVIDIGPVRRRAVLALMALGGEAGVRLSELSELLWPGDAPASAVAMIHGHISKLRGLLAGPPGRASPPTLIAWTGTSYHLRLGPYCLADSLGFAELARGGDEAAGSGELDRACRFYERALALWRGRAAADLDLLQENCLVVALNQLRSEVAARYAETAGRVGCHELALPQLRRACLADPLNEVLHARLITALGSTGRMAEAAEVLERLAKRLGAHLGIGPSRLAWSAYAQVAAS